MAYLYRHIRLDTNQIFYIGIGIRENYRRAKTIVSRNSYWKNIVAKTEWISEIVFDDITFEEAKKKEVEFIKLYGRSDLGLGTLANMTDGGDGRKGTIVNEKTRNKISDRFSGKPLSEAHRNKISLANTGKKVSDVSKAKMRAAKIGTRQTSEVIDKRRVKLIGNKSRTGMKTSDEIRAKQKAGQIARRIRESLLKN